MFKITIEEIKDVTVGQREWKPIGPVDKAEYGYTPEVEVTKQVTREIYKQEVEELDLVEVIRAVNEKRAKPQHT